MRNLALKYPSIAGLITFLMVSVGGSLLGFAWGLSVMSRNPCERMNASDPCDGAVMAAGMIWSFSAAASIVVGGVIAVSVIHILLKMAKSKEASA